MVKDGDYLRAALIELQDTLSKLEQMVAQEPWITGRSQRIGKIQGIREAIGLINLQLDRLEKGKPPWRWNREQI